MGIWQSVLNKFDMIAEIKNTASDEIPYMTATVFVFHSYLCLVLSVITNCTYVI